jgi:hypothetical protein
MHRVYPGRPPQCLELGGEQVLARPGALAAHHVQEAIEIVLGASEDEDRRRMLGLVELLRRLATEAGARARAAAPRFRRSAEPRRRARR